MSPITRRRHTNTNSKGTMANDNEERFVCVVLKKPEEVGFTYVNSDGGYVPNPHVSNDIVEQFNGAGERFVIVWESTNGCRIEGYASRHHTVYHHNMWYWYPDILSYIKPLNVVGTLKALALVKNGEILLFNVIDDSWALEVSVVEYIRRNYRREEYAVLEVHDHHCHGLSTTVYFPSRE